MSHTLATLLAAKEPLFSLSIQQLEKQTGKQSLDIRLNHDVHQAAQARLRTFGLDVGDTAGKELYHALRHRAYEDDLRLATVLGLTAATTPSLVRAIKRSLAQHAVNDAVWAPKASALKKCIKKLPPKTVMKTLGYRSVDSLLKHEKPAVILACAHLRDDTDWLYRLYDRLTSLTPADFERRSVAILSLPQATWAKLLRSGLTFQPFVPVPVTASLIAVPISSMPAGTVLFSYVTILRAIIDARVISAFSQFSQVQPDFGERFVGALRGETALGPELAGTKIQWRVLHQHFGSQKDTYHAELFEPHVSLVDMELRRVEELLSHIDPQLRDWSGMHHVASLHGTEVVSCALADIMTDCVEQRTYEQRSLEYCRDALWDELYARYVGVAAFEKTVLEHLQSSSLSMEDL